MFTLIVINPHITTINFQYRTRLYSHFFLFFFSLIFSLFIYIYIYVSVSCGTSSSPNDCKSNVRHFYSPLNVPKKIHFNPSILDINPSIYKYPYMFVFFFFFLHRKKKLKIKIHYFYFYFFIH